jgi:hypothetical protein
VLDDRRCLSPAPLANRAVVGDEPANSSSSDDDSNCNEGDGGLCGTRGSNGGATIANGGGASMLERGEEKDGGKVEVEVEGPPL